MKAFKNITEHIHTVNKITIQKTCCFSNYFLLSFSICLDTIIFLFDCCKKLDKISFLQIFSKFFNLLKLEIYPSEIEFWLGGHKQFPHTSIVTRCEL